MEDKDKNRKRKILIVIILLIILLLIMIWFLFFNKVEYTVTICYDNTSTAVENKKISKGLTVGDITVPTRDGYKFLYWTVDGKRVKSTDKITKDIKLVSIWESSKPKIKINLDNDGGVGSTEVFVEEGSILIEPVKPTKEGYKFLYWESNGEKYDFTKPVIEEIELKAVWQEIEEYTVTFDSNGGSSVLSQKIEKDNVVAKPSNPTRNGFDFVGWLLDGTQYDFLTKITKDITLVAKWKKQGETEKFKVTFIVDGKTYKTVEVEENKTVSKPSNPTKSNYTFKSWQLNGKDYNFSTKVTSNISLTATFNKNKCSVTFDPNGGSNVTNRSVDCGNKIGELPSTTKNGYTFEGWFYGNTKYDSNTVVNNNIILKAMWKVIDNYTVHVSNIDNYSPQRELSVYHNDTQIDVKAIKTLDNIDIGFRANITDIERIQNEYGGLLKVVLNDNSEVNAHIVI